MLIHSNYRDESLLILEIYIHASPLFDGKLMCVRQIFIQSKMLHEVMKKEGQHCTKCQQGTCNM